MRDHAMNEEKSKRVCLGVFVGAHGVKGAAKVKTFTETPRDIAAYGPVQSEDGVRVFSLKFIRDDKPGVVLVTAPEIQSREDAMALSGTKLFVDRNALPSPHDEDEFYHDDLIGAQAVAGNGRALGEIVGVYDFGAGDVIELANIPGLKGARFVPFTRSAIPTIDLEAGVVEISEAFLSLFEESPPPDDGPGRKPGGRAGAADE